MSNPEKLKGCISELAKDSEKITSWKLTCLIHKTCMILIMIFVYVRKEEDQWGPKAGSLFIRQEKYVIHIVALDPVLRHGLILKGIHRAIEFDQSAWLAPYINFNSQLRMKTKNDFEKDFFKLMNNSVFRKTMETLENTRTSISQQTRRHTSRG